MNTIGRSPAPAIARQSAFLVGQDGAGHWLAVETHGHGGGIFASRDKAIRYARREGRGPEAFRLVDGPIDLFGH